MAFQYGAWQANRVLLEMADLGFVVDSVPASAFEPWGFMEAFSDLIRRVGPFLPPDEPQLIPERAYLAQAVQ